ncbi:visual pigment-like receptor peropsin isoform X2 [Ptychodera flava]|uniref:visual pigment-like receptor peropsin isoform X2 n=1 Tax=Ptychodera flava TaxID=63121 RepID=UPI00396A6828
MMATAAADEMPVSPGVLTAQQHYALSVTLFALGMAMLESPFTAISHFHGKWMFGDVACRLYGFAGMFFGISNIFMLAFISLDRCWTTCSPTEVEQKAKFYPLMVAIGWFVGLVSAGAPLFGWSSYEYEPSGTSCALDYMKNDATYIRYIICVFVTCFAVPILIMVYSYGKASRVVKATGKVTDWANESNVTLQSALCVMQLVFCWGMYGVNCLWTVFAPSSTLPPMLTVIAPVLAKTSPIINSWLYIYRVKKFRGAVGDMFKPKEE